MSGCVCISDLKGLKGRERKKTNDFWWFFPYDLYFYKIEYMSNDD
jgi:hypothetical protein